MILLFIPAFFSYQLLLLYCTSLLAAVVNLCMHILRFYVMTLCVFVYLLSRSCRWCAKVEWMENSSSHFTCDLYINMSCWCLPFLPVTKYVQKTLLLMPAVSSFFPLDIFMYLFALAKLSFHCLSVVDLKFWMKCVTFDDFYSLVCFAVDDSTCH